MNYKHKYLKYKLKYLNIKKIYGGENLSIPLNPKILPSNNPDIKYISELYPPKSCEMQCDDDTSKKFININNTPEKLLDNLRYFGKKELIKSLTHGKSLEFYKTRRTITYSKETYILIKNVCELLKLKVVMLGVGELLADFAISLYELSVSDAKANGKELTDDYMSDFISNYYSILSSMNDWSAEKNQAIIIDTFYDYGSLKDVWGITNSCIGLILNKECIINNNGKFQVDFDLAIKNVGKCRVTIFEICLIYKMILKNPSKYFLLFIPLKENINDEHKYTMVFIINIDIYNDADDSYIPINNNTIPSALVTLIEFQQNARTRRNRQPHRHLTATKRSSISH